MMFTGAFEVGGVAGPIMGALLILESLAAFAWYLLVGNRVFFGQVSEKAATTTGDPSPVITVPLIILMVLCFLAPVVGWPFVQYLGVGVFR